MDRRALLAVALSLLILIAYEQFLRMYYGPPAPHTAPTPATTPSGSEASLPPTAAGSGEGTTPVTGSASHSISTPANVPERLIQVESPLYVALLSTRGARLVSWRLKHYRTTVDPQSPPLELVVPGGGGEALFTTELRGSNVPTWEDIEVAYTTDALDHIDVANPAGVALSLRSNAESPQITKTFRFYPDRYDLEHTVEVRSIPEGYTELATAWTRAKESETLRTPVFSKVAYLQGKKLHEHQFEDLRKGLVLSGELWWTGFTDQYFFAGLAPKTEPDAPRRLWLKHRGEWVEQKFLLPLTAPEIKVSYTAFLGPKDVDALETAGYRFDRAVDLGWFGFVALPLLRVMQFSHRFTGNYGVDIILLTILVKLLFIPLTNKSFKSMQQLQRLQPQMAKIREKYKDDPQQMNKEMLELYRRHKVNPLGGCLPMLLQLPVFVGLYSALTHAVELRHAPFVGWIRDLSAPDRLGSIAIPFVEPPGIPVLTLLMGASMFVQQWMTPSTGDPAQRQVMLLMPILFTFMFIGFPSGLTLYWLVNNVLTIAQQYYMTRTVK